MGIAAASVVSIVLFIALGSGLDVFLDLLIGIFYIYAAFRSRAMLEDHFTAKGVTDFRLNGVWTFFFSHFYLQYKINQAMMLEFFSSQAPSRPSQVPCRPFKIWLPNFGSSPGCINRTY